MAQNYTLEKVQITPSMLSLKSSQDVIGHILSYTKRQTVPLKLQQQTVIYNIVYPQHANLSSLSSLILKVETLINLLCTKNIMRCTQRGFIKTGGKMIPTAVHVLSSRWRQVITKRMAASRGKLSITIIICVIISSIVSFIYLFLNSILHVPRLQRLLKCVHPMRWDRQ